VIDLILLVATEAVCIAKWVGLCVCVCLCVCVSTPLSLSLTHPTHTSNPSISQ